MYVCDFVSMSTIKQVGCGDCMAKWFCSPCEYGRAVEIAFGHSCVGMGISFIFPPACMILSCVHRGSLRIKYGFEVYLSYELNHNLFPSNRVFNKGSKCQDCALSCFCSPCHLSQMIHEIESREGKKIGCCGKAEEIQVCLAFAHLHLYIIS